MKNLLLRLGVGISVLLAVSFPLSATVLAVSTTTFDATTMGDAVGIAGDSAGLTGADDLPTMVGRTVSVLLGILGLLFVALVVYAGFLYLTSNGEEANVKKAKKMLTQAVIGLVLIVSAYAITLVVTDALSTITAT